jgi:cytochrome c oxidase assembly protein subunit 15
MTDWRPVTGWLPPLDAAAWQAEFAKYQASPEFQQINFSMQLADFKTIFWFEYSHRLLGRVIGLAFFVPFLWFLVRGRLDGPLTTQLAVIFVLGGLQGAVGWFMVASGLDDRPYVSQYRLALHLGLAVLIYALILLVAIRLVWRPVYGLAETAIDRLRRAAWWLVGLIGLTMLSGAFVAGLDAGRAYNTFPLMDGRLVPAAYLADRPWWINPFENIAAVQFDHRVLAIVTLAAVLGFAFWAQRFRLSLGSTAIIGALAAMVLLQVGLGVATLLLFVPVWLGALHQAGALVLLTLALVTTQRLRRQ